MPDCYLTVRTSGYFEFEEKKSLFIGHVENVSDEEDATYFIKKIKTKYHDARHNAYAYLLHSGGIKYSDDGEPQGSAGLPILDCIRKAGVEDTCVVVTRYFGGILLGTGGLFRAYSKAASSALESAGILEYDLFAVIAMRCSYSLYQHIMYEIDRFGGVIDKVDFSEDIFFKFTVKSTLAEEICMRLRDICAGRIQIEIVETRYGYI